MAAKAIIAATDGSHESLHAVLSRHAAGSTVGSITHPVVGHAHGPVAIVPGG